MRASPDFCHFVDLWRLSSGTLRVLVDRHAVGGGRCMACPSVGAEVGYLCRNHGLAEQALCRRDELWIGGAARVDRRRRYSDPIGTAVGGAQGNASGAARSGVW